MNWSKIKVSELRHAAKIAKHCADDLKIPQPSIYFIQETDSHVDTVFLLEKVLGFAKDGAIYLTKGQESGDLYQTIAHETKHIQQEIEAESYAQETAKREPVGLLTRPLLPQKNLHRAKLEKPPPDDPRYIPDDLFDAFNPGKFSIREWLKITR
jgi:hypothetical protein